MTTLRFSILAPDLDTPARRMLKVMMGKAGMAPIGQLTIHQTLGDCEVRNILSIGKAGLDVWHDFGIIGVGAHHGNVFRHWSASQRAHVRIMVLHHPGSLMQLTFAGHEAKDQMAFDLARWRGVLEGRVEDLRQQTCGRCATRRGKTGPTRRPAEHWVMELDDCGLCEDCYRARGKITRKKAKRTEPSKAEAQIAGQLEMIPDGQHVMLAKR